MRGEKERKEMKSVKIRAGLHEARNLLSFFEETRGEEKKSMATRQRPK